MEKSEVVSYDLVLSYFRDSRRLELLRRLEVYLANTLARTRGKIITIRTSRIVGDKASTHLLHNILRTLIEVAGVTAEPGRGTGGRKTLVLKLEDAEKLLETIRRILAELAVEMEEKHKVSTRA